MDTDSLLETGQLLQQEHVLHEQHSVKACEKKMRYLEERYDELQSQLGSHRQTIAEYEHSEQMIKGKLNSLETQLQDRETSAKGSREIAERELLKLLQQHEQKYEHIKQQHEQELDLVMRGRKLNNHSSKRVQQVHEAHASELNTLKKECESVLAASQDVWESKVEEHKMIRDTLAGKLDKLNKVNLAAGSELHQTLAQLRVSNKLVNELRTGLREAVSAKTEMTMRCKHIESEIQGLRSENLALLAAYNTSQEELSMKSDLLKRTQSTMKSLGDNDKEYVEMKKELVSAQFRYVDVMSSLQALKGTHDQVVNANASCQASLDGLKLAKEALEEYQSEQQHDNNNTALSLGRLKDLSDTFSYVIHENNRVLNAVKSENARNVDLIAKLNERRERALEKVKNLLNQNHNKDDNGAQSIDMCLKTCENVDDSACVSQLRGCLMKAFADRTNADNLLQELSKIRDLI